MSRDCGEGSAAYAACECPDFGVTGLRKRWRPTKQHAFSREPLERLQIMRPSCQRCAKDDQDRTVT